MKRRPLSLSERFGSMTRNLNGDQESNVSANIKKIFNSDPSDKRSSNEGRSWETKENQIEHEYVTRKNLTVQVTKGPNSEVKPNSNNNKCDKQTPNAENKEYSRHQTQSQNSHSSGHSHIKNNTNHGKSTQKEHYQFKNEKGSQSRNGNSSSKFVPADFNKESHSVTIPFQKQQFNDQNEAFSHGNQPHTGNNSYPSKHHYQNKNSYQNSFYRGNRVQGDPRQERNKGRTLSYQQNSGQTYPKSPGATYPKSPGQTYSKSPGQTYSKSPGQTYPKSPGRAYTKSPHFENYQVNQYENAPFSNVHQNNSTNMYSISDDLHGNILLNARHDYPHTQPSPKPVVDTNQGNPSTPNQKIDQQSKLLKSSAFKHSQSIGSGEQPLEAYNNPLSPRYINYKGSSRNRSISGDPVMRKHTSPFYRTSPSFHKAEFIGMENQHYGSDVPGVSANQSNQVPPDGMLHCDIPNEGIQSYPLSHISNGENIFPSDGGFRHRHFSEGQNKISTENFKTVHPLQRQSSFGPPLNRQNMFQGIIPSGNINNCFPQDLGANTEVHNALGVLCQNDRDLHMPKPHFRDSETDFNSDLLTPDMTFRNFSSPEAQQPTRAQRHSEQPVIQQNNSDNINVQNEQDELVNTLLQQCQAMVKNNHDKQALNKVVSIIKQETCKQKANMLDGKKDTENMKMASKKTNDSVTPASILDKLCNSEARFSPVYVSPDDKADNSSTSMKFEGRTLLKGGVAPRHIPKNYVDKIHKERPVDPRLSFPNYLKSNSVNIPLPPWAADIYGMETVRRLETMYKLRIDDVPLPVWASDCHSVKSDNGDKLDGHSTPNKHEIVCNNSDAMTLPVDMEIEETNHGTVIVSNDPPGRTGELIDTSVLDVEGRIEALVKSVREESANKIQQAMPAQKYSPKFTYRNCGNKPVQVVIGSAKKDQNSPWEKPHTSERCKSMDKLDPKCSKDSNNSLQLYDNRRNEKALQLYEDKSHDDIVTYRDKTYEIQHENSDICRKYEVVSTKTVIIERGHGRSRSDRSKSHERVKDNYDSRYHYDRHDRDSYRYKRSPSPSRSHYKSRHRHLSESDKSCNSLYHDRCYNDFSPCKKRKLKKELVLDYGGDIVYTPDEEGYTSSDTRE